MFIYKSPSNTLGSSAIYRPRARRSTQPSSLSTHAPYAHAVYGSIHRPFSLLLVSRPTPVGAPQGCPKCRVSASSTSKRLVDQPQFGWWLSAFGSNLSGPFFLFNSTSLPGQVLSRNARQIRYLNRGPVWAFRTKHESTWPLHPCTPRSPRPLRHSVCRSWTGCCRRGKSLRNFYGGDIDRK